MVEFDQYYHYQNDMVRRADLSNECYKYDIISAQCRELHLNFSDMVTKKQPGGTGVSEGVAPITGMFLSVSIKYRHLLDFTGPIHSPSFQWLCRQYCICTSIAGRACDLD